MITYNASGSGNKRSMTTWAGPKTVCDDAYMLRSFLRILLSANPMRCSDLATDDSDDDDE